MKLSAEQIIAALPSLPDGERRKVLALAGALTSPQTAQDETTESRVYSVLGETLRLVGARPGPLGVFRRSQGYAPFRDAVPVLLEFIREDVAPKNRAEEIRALRVLFRMLVRRLRRDKVPVTPITLARNLSRIPSIVDQQFPGYRQTRVLRVLVNRDSLASV